MANAITSRIIKIVAESTGVAAGVKSAEKQLDSLGAKVEQTADRVSRASSRARFDPQVRDTLRKNNVISSLASQRFAEEQRQAQVRSRIAFSLANQRRGEEDRQRREAHDLAAKRSRITFSLAEQRRAEEARARESSLFRRVGSSAGGLAGRGAAGVTGFVGGLASGVVAVGFSEVVSAIASTGSRVVGAGLDVVRVATTTAVEAAMRAEDNRIGFGVLTGSQREGDRLIGQLQRLAIETPFKLQEVFGESKLLLSYGVSVGDLTKRLRQLGDVASGTGVDLGRLSLAFGQVLAKGRLQGPEIRQFTEAGVGIRDFVAAFNELEGRNVGVQAFLALSEQGQVSSRVVEKAIDRMTSAGGRFFNLMDSRSKTVSGRFNALSESLELVAQRIGTSVFEKFDVAGILGGAVDAVGNLNLDGIDRKIGSLAKSAIPFGSEVLAGFRGVIDEAGKAFRVLIPDVRDLDAVFRFTSRTIIPGVIEAGVTLTNVFFSVAKVGLLLADSFLRIYNAAPPASKLPDLRSVVAGLGAGAVGTLVGGPVVGLAAALSVAGGVEAGLRATGESGRGSGKTPIIAELEKQIEQFQRALAGADLAGAFRGGLRKAPFDRGAASRFLETQRAKFGEEQVQDVIENGLQVVGFERGQDRVRVNDRFFDPDRNRFVDRVRFFDRIPVEIQEQILAAQAALKVKPPVVDVPFGPEADRLNRLSQSLFEQGIVDRPLSKVVGRDVERFQSLLPKIADGLGPVTNALGELADKVLPRFGERAAELQKRLAKPVDAPFTDFADNLRTVELLGGPLARLAGNAITAEQARRLRGELGQELVERFKPAELRSAPLVRAGSQEAEQALTRAIYEARNNARTPEEELAEAIKEAKRVQDENNKRLDRLADALENPTGFPFIGLGFGQ
jgi:hypothetical protein